MFFAAPVTLSIDRLIPIYVLSKAGGLLPLFYFPRLLWFVPSILVIRRVLWMILLFAACGSNAANVRVTAKPFKGGYSLVVQTVDLLDATITIEVTGDNLVISKPTPLILDTKGQTNFVALTFSQKDASKPWKYNWSYGWHVGGREGTSDGHAYDQPFATNATYKVSQGFGGSFSHNDPGDWYAIDWLMPEGTPIHAARGGTVVAVEQRFDRGGSTREFERKANYITIRHEDGTYGDYMHLKKGGVSVKLGSIVSAGQQIGFSGNTGYSSAPHLHFCVFQNRANGDAVLRQSLPFTISGVAPQFLSAKPADTTIKRLSTPVSSRRQ